MQCSPEKNACESIIWQQGFSKVYVWMKCERKLEIEAEEVRAAAKTEDLMIGTQIENYILFSCLCSTLKSIYQT